MNAEQTATRLQEAAAKCLSSLDAWNKDLKNDEARSSLLEAVHELRKVTSRLEIDIAMNDRVVLNAKPIPIPEHKSKIEKKKKKPLNEMVDMDELKEAGEKRKIKIAEKQADNNSSDDNEKSAKSSNNENGEKSGAKPRRPRRKKREEEDN